MKHPQLVSEKRTVLGKKVKKLRREGLLPANVYGKGLDSTAIQVKLADFQKVFKEVGETGLIDLEVNGEKKPVLVKNMHQTFPHHIPLHVDFYQVNLKEKVKTMVPIVLTGEPKAVADKIGLLLQTLSDVEIEALPEALPENIEISVENLAAVDEQLSVEDLKAPEGVAILTAGDQIIAKIGELVVEEPEPETPAEGEEGAEGAAGEASEEGKESEGGEGEKKEESAEETAEEKKEE
ncbi:MAG TPA: 50S ribosomal protein L25 [Patescibacteria group bacterium]|nr:50S ribosomal protein L25 [Patescibacteria group bacterium]